MPQHTTKPLSWRTLRVLEETTSEIGGFGLEQRWISAYDEAIAGHGIIVISMKFDLKFVSQVFCFNNFQTRPRLKSHSVRR